MTVKSADNKEIYGEFSDADWENQATDVGENHIFTGVAGDGTFATFQRLDEEGISNVRYSFEIGKKEYEGTGQLLKPMSGGQPGTAVVRIESISNPF